MQTLLQQQLDSLEQDKLLREIISCNRVEGVYIFSDKKRYVSFACNDYLGLCNHPKIREAAIDVIDKYGFGAGASRLITGSCDLYEVLEAKLAKLKNTEASLVFGSGYLANIGIIPALVGKDDLIVADKLVHACMIDGARLAKAKFLRFRHNNLASCDRLLRTYRKNYKNCLILTETVFSMDGDRAPIAELLHLAKKHDCIFISDDAHGLGVLKATYNGVGDNLRHIKMGTLSKAAGGYGGYVCADTVTIDYLKNKARSLIFSTALPPCVIAANIAAIDIISKDKQLLAKPVINARYFAEKLGMRREKIKNITSAIVPLIIGDNEKTIELAKYLKNEGFYVPAIRYPAVAKNSARLRFAFSVLHTKEMIDALVLALQQASKEKRVYE